MKEIYNRKGYSTKYKVPTSAYCADNTLFDDLEYVLEMCAEDYYYNHDGFESRWPILFELSDGLGNVIEEKEIQLEYEPTFTCQP